MEKVIDDSMQLPVFLSIYTKCILKMGLECNFGLEYKFELNMQTYVPVFVSTTTPMLTCFEQGTFIQCLHTYTVDNSSMRDKNHFKKNIIK